MSNVEPAAVSPAHGDEHQILTDKRSLAPMRSVRLMGAQFAAITESEAVRMIIDAAIANRGHWTITANLDHLRRYTSKEPLARELIDHADLVVADGTPLVWASWLAGASLPERVTGSNMIWSICREASLRGVSTFLVGGDPGVAQRAAQVLSERYRDLNVAGTLCPPLGFENDAQELDRIRRAVRDAEPQIVFVGLGFPKQDVLIEHLRLVLPGASFIGVGISLSFVTGEISRAPSWTHIVGLEWLYRLLQEPKRLGRRYLIRGVPFALRLLTSAARHRVHKDRTEVHWGSQGGSDDALVVSRESPKPTIHHFGPDPSHVGGMSSVIRILIEHQVGGEAVKSHPTWRPNSRFDTARLTAIAALSILGMRRGQIAHIHVSERGSFIREGALVALARKRGLITVITIHGGFVVTFAQRHSRLVSAVLQQAQLITCLDEEVLDLARRLAPDVRSKILPNPISMDPGSGSADETDQLVVFAGEISHMKGADVLLRAWRLVAEQCAEARCIVVGPPKDFSFPETERLEVRKSMSPQEIMYLLRSARVVALPSRVERMPMILTEAMSVGRPFVSTPVGGIPELAREGGMLVTVGDAVGLATHLTDLLRNPALAKQIGEQGRKFCSETRSVEIIGARLEKLYAAASQTR